MIFLYRVILCSHTSLYFPFSCISALHLYVSGELFGCLSHQDPFGCSKKSCELWNYCLGVISSLMQLVRLVQSIECRGGRCVLQETSFLHPCTSCTFLLPSIPLFLGFLGVPITLWLFNSPPVGIALGVCLPFFTWVKQSYPWIGLLDSRPSHNIYIYIYIYMAGSTKRKPFFSNF